MAIFWIRAVGRTSRFAEEPGERDRVLAEAEHAGDSAVLAGDELGAGQKLKSDSGFGEKARGEPILRAPDQQPREKDRESGEREEAGRGGQDRHHGRSLPRDQIGASGNP